MTKVWFLVCSSMDIQPRESLLLQQVFWRPLRLVRTLAPTVWVNGFGHVWMCVQLLCFRLFDSNFRHVSSTVWGKVMFLHLCVILFMGGCLPPGVSASGGGVCMQGGSASRGRGWSLHQEGICIGGGWEDPPHRIAYYGIQSTSLHSVWWNTFCFELIFYHVLS